MEEKTEKKKKQESYMLLFYGNLFIFLISCFLILMVPEALQWLGFQEKQTIILFCAMFLFIVGIVSK